MTQRKQASFLNFNPKEGSYVVNINSMLKTCLKLIENN